MGSGHRKGSNFERHICKQLSHWWTGGERDDVFWRSSQSGGRATQRAKSGKKTYGSYGDIAAVDPIGEPLMRLFTIELKRGRAHGHPEDLVDAMPTVIARPFEKAICQAMEARNHSGSCSWLLICQRDRKVPFVYMSNESAQWIQDGGFARRPPVARYDLRINTKKGPPFRLRFIGLPLEHFFARVSPLDIYAALK